MIYARLVGKTSFIRKGFEKILRAFSKWSFSPFFFAMGERKRESSLKCVKINKYANRYGRRKREEKKNPAADELLLRYICGELKIPDGKAWQNKIKKGVESHIQYKYKVIAKLSCESWKNKIILIPHLFYPEACRRAHSKNATVRNYDKKSLEIFTHAERGRPKKSEPIFVRLSSASASVYFVCCKCIGDVI